MPKKRKTARKTGQMVSRVVPRKKKKRKPKESHYPGGLNAKEFKFVDGLFLFFHNGTRAARYAGYGKTYGASAVAASLLLNKDKVKAEVARRQDTLRETSTALASSTAAFLLRVASVAVTDLAEITPTSFTMRDLSKQTREEQWALQTYSRNETKFGPHEKFALVDRVKLIELAMRLLGHLPSENQSGIDPEVVRKMLDAIQNGNRDKLTGVPANGGG